MKNPKIQYYLLLVFISCIACASVQTIEDYAQHYRTHQDYESLSKVVELLPMSSDTSYVSQLLGEPLDMGFDYRYLVDSMGLNNCVIGAVFHIDDAGKIDQKWIDEICE